jgi:hypothetical protein
MRPSLHFFAAVQKTFSPAAAKSKGRTRIQTSRNSANPIRREEQTVAINRTLDDSRQEGALQPYFVSSSVCAGEMGGFGH